MASTMIRNERAKLFANFLTALGVGLVAIGVFRPAFETGGDPWWMGVWFLVGLALHGLAHYVLGYMR